MSTFEIAYCVAMLSVLTFAGGYVIGLMVECILRVPAERMRRAREKRRLGLS